MDRLEELRTTREDLLSGIRRTKQDIIRFDSTDNDAWNHLQARLAYYQGELECVDKELHAIEQPPDLRPRTGLDTVRDRAIGAKARLLTLDSLTQALWAAGLPTATGAGELITRELDKARKDLEETGYAAPEPSREAFDAARAAGLAIRFGDKTLKELRDNVDDARREVRKAHNRLNPTNPVPAPEPEEERRTLISPQKALALLGGGMWTLSQHDAEKAAYEHAVYAITKLPELRHTLEEHERTIDRKVVELHELLTRNKRLAHELEGLKMALSNRQASNEELAKSELELRRELEECGKMISELCIDRADAARALGSLFEKELDYEKSLAPQVRDLVEGWKTANAGRTDEACVDLDRCSKLLAAHFGHVFNDTETLYNQLEALLGAELPNESQRNAQLRRQLVDLHTKVANLTTLLKGKDNAIVKLEGHVIRALDIAANAASDKFGNGQVWGTGKTIRVKKLPDWAQALQKLLTEYHQNELACMPFEAPEDEEGQL